jgi:hypothetical protein
MFEAAVGTAAVAAAAAATVKQHDYMAAVGKQA